MQVNRALADISALRLQMARSTEFHGYGPFTLATTGGLALAAAFIQSVWVPAPLRMIEPYLILWLATAMVCVALIAAEAIRRSRKTHLILADDMLAAAAEQFLPAAFAGTMLTLTLLHSAPETLWMLPGLWQLILSLGMFAACRTLPKPIALVPVWYFATGLSCLMLARGEHALSPWAMGLPFAIGQCLAAALLLYSYRGSHDET